VIVDSSVVLCLFFSERRATEAADLLSRHAAELHMSTVNIAETLMRLRSQVAKPRLAATIRAFRRMPIAPIPVDLAQAELAASARFRYPKLNFGDCFAYAAAKLTKMPLLTFDADFAGVDVDLVGLASPNA
jgi:ribonuclease VapC